MSIFTHVPCDSIEEAAYFSGDAAPMGIQMPIAVSKVAAIRDIIDVELRVFTLN